MPSAPPLLSTWPMGQPHQLGVELPFAGNQFGVGEHGPAQPFQVGLPTAAEMGIQQGHLGQLELQRGGAAVIHAGDQLRPRQPQQLADPFEHLLLQRMVGLQVALDGPVHLPTGGQEGCVLAGAIVLQWTAGSRWGGALEVLGVQFGAPQQFERLSGVDCGTGMGSAGDRQAPLAGTHAIGGAAGYEHGGLEGLQGGAHEAQLLGITGAHQHPTALIADHRMDPVPRFRDPVAQQPDLQGGDAGTARTGEAGGQAHGGGRGSDRADVREPGRAPSRAAEGRRRWRSPGADGKAPAAPDGVPPADPAGAR